MDIKLDVIRNDFNLDINKVLGVAKRDNNKKRNFLFVTTLLGKCLISNADICRATGFLLADLLYGSKSFNQNVIVNAIKENRSSEVLKEELKKAVKTDENVFVMGFAETATGLGMSVASAIEDSYYIHTSRESINDVKSIFDFEEEHSHATTHQCYLKNMDKLKNADKIILVDDEITTGNTCLNLIKELKKISKAKSFAILTIFDWRNQLYRDKYNDFIKEYNVNIEVHSIMSGHVTSLNNNVYYQDKEKDYKSLYKSERIDTYNIENSHFISNTPYGKKSFNKHSGLFGVSYDDMMTLENESKEIANYLLSKYDGKKILILGHGENIYIPSRIASYVSNDLNIQTTTRSPLITEKNTIIDCRVKFEFEGVVYYLYNVDEIENNYDVAIMITDSDLNFKLTKNMEILKI